MRRKAVDAEMIESVGHTVAKLQFRSIELPTSD